MTKKQRKIYYTSLFFLGLCFMFWQIILFRKTVIPTSIPILIIAMVGLATAVFEYKNYSQTYSSYSGFSVVFFTIMQCVVGYGFIVSSLFFVTNYYLADEDKVEKRYVIIDRSSMTGSKRRRHERQPVFHINYEGTKKELVFPHEFYEEMDTYESVQFEVREGFLGFDILQNERLY